MRNNEISGSAGVSVKIKSDKQEYDKGGNIVENNRYRRAPTRPDVQLHGPPRADVRERGRDAEPVFFNNTGDYGDGATPPNITDPC